VRGDAGDEGHAVATVAMYLFHARHVEHLERETAPGSPAPFDDEILEIGSVPRRRAALRLRAT
jgi:hypothetical protein